MTEPNKLQETFDEGLDVLQGDASTVVELIKIRVGFWDKLVILDAGTLALSFTAASTFRGHVIGDGGINYLFAAWKMLITSIALALLAQWFASNFLLFYRRQKVALMAHRRFLWVKENLEMQGFSLSPSHNSLIVDQEAEISLTKKLLNPFEMISQGAGFVAQFSTIVAFYWLYRFSHVNLTNR